MTPYFVVLFFSLLFCWIYQKTKVSFSLALTVIVLALFMGLRSIEVGTDTGGYARSFLNMGSFSTKESAAEALTTEYGWGVLNWLLYHIIPRYWFLFTVVGFFTVASSIYVIKKISPAVSLSVFCYITLGFYLFGFAGMRQSVAIAIYGLAIPFLLKHDFKRYALIVLIGALFHRTVLIGLPLYFVFRLKYSAKSVALIIFGSIIVANLIPQLMSFSTSVEDRYGVYLEVEGGGELFALFYTIMAVFFWTQRLKIEEYRRERYDTLMMMLISGAIIYIIVILAGLYGEVTRLAMYFQLAILFLWAELYKYRKQKLSSGFWMVVVAVHIVYFYIYLDKIGHTVPYVLNASFN